MALAANAGLDPIDIMVDLRAKHEKPENTWMGVDAVTGKVEDMLKQNVVEPIRTKLQVIRSATEAACMILRIDDVVAAKGTKDLGKEGKPPGGPGGMPGAEEY
jgi:chaperonin GroEL (HSP60 family)